MEKFKLLLTTFLLVFVQLSGKTQLTSDTINGNSVLAVLFDQGGLFNNPSIGAAGYELPSGSGNHLIFNSGFWFAGTNQNGDLKLAARKFGQATDFYRGPYSLTGDYSNTAYINEYQGGIWTVSKSEIIQHINNYNQPNYVAPQGIENWPGNGNPNIGVADQLAPYVDVNNNNIYEPYQGDYPCIKGDVASYQIMHDDSTHNNSGGERIGAEIHIMVYQIASSNYIDSTTFIEVKVFNKGQNSFTNFKSSLFIDGDIGFSDDEYIGSNPSRNLMYNYNGTNSDPGGNGQPGYGSNPPTVGVVSLNNTIDYSGYFNRPDLGGPYSHAPSTPSDYWNYMNGKWKDGTDWTQGGNGYGGTTPTQHLYDGNPFQGTGWTELDTDGMGTSNSYGDRRFVMTTAESNFVPGDTLEYHYAVIANRRGDHLENVQGIIDYADSVQQYYNNMSTSCMQQGTTSVDVSDLNISNVKLFPNPATNQVIVTWSNVEADNIIIYSFHGKIVGNTLINENEGKTVLDISSLSKGIYFVKIGNTTQKLVIQ
ncbi:MAG: T9SS type A sorting domain-containing protein [Brumimicrobium sp.]